MIIIWLQDLLTQTKKLASKLYECIQNCRIHSSNYLNKMRVRPPTIRGKLERDASQMQKPNSWAWKDKSVTSYFITSKLSALHMGVESLSSWWQRETSVANHVHIFWTCPKIQPFWYEVAIEIKKITKRL